MYFLNNINFQQFLAHLNPFLKVYVFDYMRKKEYTHIFFVLFIITMIKKRENKFI